MKTIHHTPAFSHLIVVLLLSATGGSALAQCADYGVPPFLAGSVDTPGVAQNAQAYLGNYAFVADGSSGLQVVDISDTANPHLVGHYSSSGDVFCVAILDSLAILGTSAGLEVVNITNPLIPHLEGVVSEILTARGMGFHHTYETNYAFVVDGNDLHIVDITVPSSPAYLSTFPTPGPALGIAIDAGRAYLACGASGGLMELSLWDPESPVISAVRDTPGGATGVALSHRYIVVSDGVAGLQVFGNVDYTLQLVGSIDTPAWANCVSVSGDRAYIGDYGQVVQVVDVSDADNLYTVDSIAIPGPAFGISAQGGAALVATGDSGLQLLVIGALPIAQLPTPDRAIYLDVVGDFAYVSCGDEGLQVIDVASPANPHIVGSTLIPWTAGALAVQGNYAYMENLWYGNLNVVDISDPTDPVFVGSNPEYGSYFYDLAVSGNYAFIARGPNGLEVIDVSNPANPQIQGSMPTPGSVRDVAISGSYAFLVDSVSGLLVVDIANPTIPQIVAETTTPEYSVALSVSGSYAYITSNYYESVTIIDISSPTTPQTLGSVTVPGIEYAVSVMGSHAYAATEYFGVQVIDISDPMNPSLGGAIQTDPDARHLIASGNYVFVAAWESGLQILPIQCDATSAVTPEIVSGNAHLIGAAPNPFNPQTTISFTLPQRDAVSLRVFDFSGNLVKTLVAGAIYPEGISQVLWNGQDNVGRPVASGIYFYQLDSGEISEAKRMVLVK